MKKEIIEINVSQIRELRNVINECGDGNLLLSNGILSTGGCSGDFGCCSKSVDIEQLLEDIESQF